MSFRSVIVTASVTALCAAGALVPVSTAAAAEHPSSLGSQTTSDPSGRISEGTILRAIDEARAVGAVREERTNGDGSHTVLFEGANGVSLELNESTPEGRLSAGSDSYGGTYVAFDAFDQNLMIGGAMSAIAAGLCALGPAICVVANVAAVLASTAIGNGGGIRCGTKALRVYPVSHRAPRCA